MRHPALWSSIASGSRRRASGSVWRVGAALAIVAALGAGPILAQPRQATHAVIFENDTIANTDRQYTNGIQYARMRPRSDLPWWARWFLRPMTVCSPSRTSSCHDVRDGLFVGQLMFTPDDISIATPIFTDRPYAGWLYGGVSFDATNRRNTRAHRFEIAVGVVGEESLAEEAQTLIHQAFGFETPRGWDNQLDFEPGLEIEYEWTQAVAHAADSSGRRWFDLSLGLGANLGNIVTLGHGGLTARVGWNINDLIGNVTIQPVSMPTGEFELYLYLRARGVGIAHTHFIDGDSRFQIDKNSTANETTWGAVASWKSVQLGYSVVTRSSEFSPLERQHRFGSLRLTWTRRF